MAALSFLARYPSDSAFFSGPLSEWRHFLFWPDSLVAELYFCHNIQVVALSFLRLSTISELRCFIFCPNIRVAVPYFLGRYPSSSTFILPQYLSGGTFFYLSGGTYFSALISKWRRSLYRPEIQVVALSFLPQ